MSVKYAATSDQKSLMSFVNGKKKSSETFLIIQETKKCFTSGFRPAPGPLDCLLCRVIVARPRLEK